MAALNELKPLLEQCSSRDRHRLTRQWQALDRQPNEQKIANLKKQLLRSVEAVNRRRGAVPSITYPQALPVADKREAIAALIAEHQVVVVAGETGSGKTTQLPKLCLELGRGVRGLVGHTQPRRLAARTVANRIAEELQVPLGQQVGYQVRFTEQVADNTLIKLMTDGILLAEIQQDRYLNRYDTLIIDEAHERSLNIDFLLGYLKQLLPKRPDLKLIITSATIDVERFSQHFDNAPVVEVSGRTYPVTVRYQPRTEEQDDLSTQVVDAVQTLLQWERAGETPGRGGDILVFLPGEREIREAHRALKKAALPPLDLLALYARLSASEQQKVFAGTGRRRVVLATNVAETSLTVPGIHYVIDSGLARISRYSVRTKVQRLPIEAISQASANQRAGRCGRIAPGLCLRLYDEQDFQQRPAFTDPEIRRTNLAAVILQMLHWRLGDIRAFPFLEPPEGRQINDGFKLLEELGAVRDNRLTPQGKQLAQLPVDPRLGRMLLAASREGALEEVLVITSALAVQDPRERPADKQQAADEKHRQDWDEQSDFLAFWNLWQRFEEQRQELSNSQFRKWCQKQFINFLRLREWRDIHHQLRLACKQLGLVRNQQPADYVRIHRALLSGLLSQIGVRTDEREYLGARNRTFVIFPGSSQHKKRPKWLVAAELLETSRLFALTVAKIEPQWLLDLAEHLVKREYYGPHYDSRRGQVRCYERISLYGLVINDKRKTDYAQVDPEGAREIFIREALVAGRYTGNGGFFAHNQALIAELEELEAKARRRDILAEETAMFDFYHARIPNDVVNLAGFERWRKQAERRDPPLLMMDRDLLMQRSAADISAAQFPNQWHWQGLTLPLSYHFEPGHERDGVTLTVPVSVLHQLPAARLEWLVPGLLQEKCVAMVKSLPKQWRKHLVPVPARVAEAMAGITVDDQPLQRVLTQQLQRTTGVDIPADAWASVAVDDYYRMNIELVDEHGQTLAMDRDLAALQQRYRDVVQESLSDHLGDDFSRGGITAWDFGELPAEHSLQRGAVTVRAYPALADQGEQVELTLCDSPAEAERLTRRGIVRLLMLEHRQTLNYLRKELLRGRELPLAVASVGDKSAVLDDVIASSYRDACLADDPLPRDPEAFAAALDRGRGEVVAVAQSRADLLAAVFSQLAALRKRLKQVNDLALALALGDMQQQLQRLFFPGFIWLTPPSWLAEYPRYLSAIEQRLDKLAGQAAKDQQRQRELQPHLERLEQRWQQGGPEAVLVDADWCHYRWLVEEMRVSLFAQALKTKLPVSAKRLESYWREHLRE